MWMTDNKNRAVDRPFSRDWVSVSVHVLVWVLALAVIGAFPSVLLVYGVLWTVLPCQLFYIGFRLGGSRLSAIVRLSLLLLACLLPWSVPVAIEALLNMFRGWNLCFPLLDYVMLGPMFTLSGWLLSLLIQRIRRNRRTKL